MRGWIVVFGERSPPVADSEAVEGLKSLELSVPGMHRTNYPIHLLQQVAVAVEGECLVDPLALGLTWGQAIHALAQCNGMDHTHHRHREMAPSGEGVVEEP